MHRLRQLFRSCSSPSTSSPSTSSPSKQSSRVRPLLDDDDDDNYYTPRDVTRRHLVRLDKRKKVERDSVSVLTYNIMADCMSEQRRCSLLKEIISYNADVVCLQETQSNHMHQFWVPELGKHNYQQFHAVKKCSRIRDPYTGFYSEGCAIFYRPEKMNLVQSYKIYFEKTGKLLSGKLAAAPKEKIRLAQDNLAICGVFELDSGTRFCVCTCHINASPDNADIKMMQVTEMIQGLKKLNRLKLPIILCGDFNTTPNEAPYKFLVDGRVSIFDGLRDESKIYLHLDLKHDLELSSAYSALFESRAAADEALEQRKLMDLSTREPLFTTRVPAFTGTLDYIMYQKRFMRVAALLELVSVKDGEYLPNDMYPSDHISLVAEFTFVPRSRLSRVKWHSYPDYIWGEYAPESPPSPA